MTDDETIRLLRIDLDLARKRLEERTEKILRLQEEITRISKQAVERKAHIIKDHYMHGYCPQQDWKLVPR